MTATTRRHATQTDPEPPTPGGAAPRHPDDPRPLDEQFRRAYPNRDHLVGHNSQEAHNFSRWCWSGEPADWHEPRRIRAMVSTDDDAQAA
jgi:hypothetical protein